MPARWYHRAARSLSLSSAAVPDRATANIFTDTHDTDHDPALTGTKHVPCRARTLSIRKHRQGMINLSMSHCALTLDQTDCAIPPRAVGSGRLESTEHVETPLECLLLVLRYLAIDEFGDTPLLGADVLVPLLNDLLHYLEICLR